MVVPLDRYDLRFDGVFFYVIVDISENSDSVIRSRLTYSKAIELANQFNTALLDLER